MSDTVVYLYRCYCIEEAVTVNIYGTTPPTACTNPNHHTSRALNSNLTTVIETISQKKFTAVESSSGWFHVTSFILDVPAGPFGTISTIETSWPANVLLWNSTIFTDSSADSTGDIVNVIAGPDTIIGTTVSNANIGETVLSVSPSVLTIVTKGIDITIFDGVNRNDLGFITAIDTVNSTVTVTNALTNLYNSGALIYLNVHTVRNLEIANFVNTYDFGQKGFRGKELPANTIFRLYYTNNSGTAKKIVCKIECYIIG